MLGGGDGTVLLSKHHSQHGHHPEDFTVELPECKYWEEVLKLETGAKTGLKKKKIDKDHGELHRYAVELRELSTVTDHLLQARQ